MVKVDPWKESSGSGFMHRLAKVVRQGLSCDSCETGYMVEITCLIVCKYRAFVAIIEFCVIFVFGR